MKMQFGLRRMHESTSDKKIVVFGAGQAYNKFYYWYHNFFDIEYLIDNNAKLHGARVFGATVYPVEKLRTCIQ